MKKILATLLLLTTCLALFTACQSGKSVDDLRAEGNYIEAYKNAEGSEKDSLLREASAAVVSELTTAQLKDPSSFVLRDAHVQVSNDGSDLTIWCILYITAKNGYGNTTSSYWYYIYRDDTEEWEILGIEDSLEASGSWEENVVRNTIERIIEDDDTVKLSSAQVKQINRLFKEDLLYKVEMIPKNQINPSH